MEDKLTQAVEDYLKAIYELSQTEGRASTSKLAEYLEVTPASVTGMIKKLASANPPLVDYQKHRGVVLTEAGMNEALETLRHHRLLELFLHDILGYPWDEVHEEAERLEHVISEKFEERIAAVLGNPKHDPHGDPIPRLDLSMPASAETRLSDLGKGDSGTIKRVRDTDADLLRHLSDLGVTPETQVKVVDYSDYDKNTHLKIKNQDEVVVLGQNITEQIYVEA
ncbi:MAG: metal-dependent transcriptional regulator [Chloroflexi bacterium]|nr:MAG: metal-dependent transcriptional regulator [Chloroflexota bacterium]MBL1193346.1 metal-dependent transcriptional regulator [Chloroflexota bacterium]NOH10638.1 metal-dependent transcriptional regulator [Chloroflexota bacterium]